MSAQIITGKFDKRYPVPIPDRADGLNREQRLAIQALAREWGTTVAGALVIIVAAYLEEQERA